MPKYIMPVGKSNFEKIRKDGNYYIDKTDLIEQIVTGGAEVTLFTRPRRFGKTLNMSMLEHFFDVRRDSRDIFQGLRIIENQSLCNEYMNQYPTIFITFKEIDGLSFDLATDRLKNIIKELYIQHSYLSDTISQYDIVQFKRLCSGESTYRDISYALQFLTRLMYNYYHKPVIVLIDEYDVPMAKGSINHYYREIIDIIRSMLSAVLKDNTYLKFAVMTGCLRVAKESIFTGLNNLYVDTISENKYNGYFGFTETEVDKLLSDTELTAYKPIIKDWYDGYYFGGKNIYCSWDVLNYVSDLQDTPQLAPKNYWANTSSNDIIRQYLESGLNLNTQIETLLRGECIYTELNDNITYNELTSTEENFWSVLYAAGYLTSVPDTNRQNITETYHSDAPVEPETVCLKLANREVKDLFATTIAKWFKEIVVKDERKELFEALWNGDTNTLSAVISSYLRRTISYYDYNENFYHAFLAGLLSGVKGQSVESNKEYGEGRADIIVRNNFLSKAVVLELKVVGNIADVPIKCDEALKQISDSKYAQPLIEEDGLEIIGYGVVFYKKRCFVKTDFS